MTIHEPIPTSARRALPAVAVVAAVLFTVQTVPAGPIVVAALWATVAWCSRR